MLKDIHISTIKSCSEHDVFTNDGHVLYRSVAIDSIVDLHFYLGLTYGKRIDRNIVKKGVVKMLSSNIYGHHVIAWSQSNNRIIGQIEIKEIFEPWYNSNYWYLDNHIVLEKFHGNGVGRELLRYVKELAFSEDISILRVYVGQHLDNSNTFYRNNQFQRAGELLELTL